MTKRIVALVVLTGLLIAGISYTSDNSSWNFLDALKKSASDVTASVSQTISKSAADIKAAGKSALDRGKTAVSQYTQQQLQTLKNKALAHVGKIAKATEELSFNEPSEVNPPSYLNKMALRKSVNDSTDKDDLYQYLEKYAPIVWLHPEEKYLPISAEEYYTSPESSVDRVVQEFPFIAASIITPGDVTFQKLYDIRQFALGKSAPSLTATEKNAIQTLMIEKNIKNYNGRGRLPIFIGIDKDVYYGSNPALNKNAAGVLNTPAYAFAFRAADGKIILQYIYLYGFNGPFRKGAAYLGAHEGDIEHVSIELDSTGKPLNYSFKSHGGGSGIIVPATQMVDVSQGGKALWNQAERWGNRPLVYSAKKSHGNYPRGASGDRNNIPYEYIYLRAGGLLNDLTAKGTKWEPNYIRIYPETDSRFNAATMGWLYFPGAMGRRGVDSPYNQGWFVNFAQERKSVIDKEGDRLITRATSQNPLTSSTTPFELAITGRAQESIEQNAQRATQAITAPLQRAQGVIVRTQQQVESAGKAATNTFGQLPLNTASEQHEDESREEAVG
jgi:hypothetical protein